MESKQYALEVNYAILGSTEDIEQIVSEIPAEDAAWQAVGIVDFVQGGSIATFNFKAKTAEGASADPPRGHVDSPRRVLALDGVG